MMIKLVCMCGADSARLWWWRRQEGERLHAGSALLSTQVVILPHSTSTPTLHLHPSLPNLTYLWPHVYIVPASCAWCSPLTSL